MCLREISTKFGPVTVKVHRRDHGWLAMLSGRHLVPAPPQIRGPVAETEDEAVQQIADAIARLPEDESARATLRLQGAVGKPEVPATAIAPHARVPSSLR